MKILACRIENFGKISDFSMDFHDGINIITEPNGWGKSTLAAFFKAMLFGFDNRREDGADEKERKIYEPWQGGLYGGELDIEVKEKRYRISRYFGATERMDSFRLMDLDTNLDSDDYSSAIGAEIFDIDRASFRRTVYIAQNDCQSTTTDSINAKLGNLAAASDDISNFENALNRIHNEMNRLSPKRATGSIKRRKNEITRLEQELKSLEAAEASAEAVQERLEAKQRQLDEINRIRGDYSRALVTASEESRRQELRSSYRQLCRDLEDRTAALDSYRDIFPDGAPNEKLIGECSATARMLEEKNTEIRHLELTRKEEMEEEVVRRIFANGVPDTAEIRDMSIKEQEIRDKQKKLREIDLKLNGLERDVIRESRESYVDPNPHRSALFPVGIVVLCFGLLFAVAAFAEHFATGLSFADPQYLIPAAAGVLFMLAGLILMIIGNQKNRSEATSVAHRLEERDRRISEAEAPAEALKDERAQLEREIEAGEQELDDFLDAYPAEENATDQERLHALTVARERLVALQGRKSDRTFAMREKEELEDKLRGQAGKLGLAGSEEILSALSRLQKKAGEYTAAVEAAELARSRKKAFEAEHDLDRILAPNECPYSLKELNGLIRSADKNVEAVRDTIDRYRRQMDDLQQQMDTRDEKQEELKAALRQQEDETARYELLEKTGAYLQRAKERFVSHYMEPITKAFDRYFSVLNAGNKCEWSIDANLCVRIREKGLLRESRWFSAGYRDLLGVALRMSLVDAMYPDEKPFLIFDDPYVNLDDEKMENGRNFTESLAKDYQVIYFTCNESRIVGGKRGNE